MSENVPNVPIQYLTFRIAGEEYAAEILRVREILRWGPVTPVPGTPSFIRGVFNLRGAVIPVIDLALKFRHPATEPGKRTCIVIVEVAEQQRHTVLGLLVEAVGQVLELTPGTIQPPPPFGTPVRVDYLRGMAEVGRKFVLLLHLDLVLSLPELMAAESAAERSEVASSPAPTPEAPSERGAS
jgi:purine-binding chemotaxis protein CheW